MEAKKQQPISKKQIAAAALLLLLRSKKRVKPLIPGAGKVANTNAVNTKLLELPPQEAAKTRIALRRVLVVEAALLSRLRKTLSRINPSDKEVAAAIRDVTKELERDILQGRYNARLIAKAQAALELDVPQVTAEKTTPEDKARAQAIAASLAAAILLRVTLLIRNKEKDAYRTAISFEDYRLRRVAATEVPNAYSRVFEELKPGPDWAKRWDATLDNKVCPLCARMHGTVVPANESFPDDLTPGDVHQFCRCVTTFIRANLLNDL